MCTGYEAGSTLLKGKEELSRLPPFLRMVQWWTNQDAVIPNNGHQTPLPALRKGESSFSSNPVTHRLE
ncbi:UNVERIFIED_CONTAM: hypothetical protein PYX00_005867 [Menopon gallinae]|uniref:Uncharacterized protein n=1 Tax=Menopon gallinae TaxID=328185 RepID=A0AAW2HTA1_9NEOP